LLPKIETWGTRAQSGVRVGEQVEAGPVKTSGSNARRAKVKSNRIEQSLQRSGKNNQAEKR
jgi:hypothetical protein